MSFGERFSRQLRTGKIRQRPAKRRSRNASRLRVEQLESRRMLALVVLPNPNVPGGVVLTPDPQMAFFDMTTGPDPDYYTVNLTFSRSTDTVSYSWTRVTKLAEAMHPDPMNPKNTYPTNGNGTINATPGLGPSIAFK